MATQNKWQKMDGCILIHTLNSLKTLHSATKPGLSLRTVSNSYLAFMSSNGLTLSSHPCLPSLESCILQQKRWGSPFTAPTVLLQGLAVWTASHPSTKTWLARKKTNQHIRRHCNKILYIYYIKYKYSKHNKTLGLILHHDTCLLNTTVHFFWSKYQGVLLWVKRLGKAYFRGPRIHEITWWALLK